MIAISLSLNSTAQVKLEPICIPDSLVSQMIDELIVKDHMQFTLSRQDSMIHIYEEKDKLYQNEVANFKLKDKGYEDIIAKLNAVVKLREAEVNDVIKHEKKAKIKATAVQIGLGVIILLILVL